MDTLTQGLLGAVAADAAMRRTLGDKAGWIGFAGGVLADFDVLIPALIDMDLPFTYHRHFTHSLAFIPVGAFLNTLPFLAWKNLRERYRAVFAASFVGFATHGLLDACTAFGTHLLWPFTQRREAWDCLPIVDPIFSLALIVGWLGSLRSKSPRPAFFALVFAIVYALFGCWQHHRAADAQEALAASRGHHIERSRVLPMPGSLVLWRSLYLSDGKIHGDNVRVPWIGSSGHESFGSLQRVLPAQGFAESPPSEKERDLLERFDTFTDHWSARSPDHPDRLGDLRLSHRWDFRPYWGLEINRDARPPLQWAKDFTSPDWDDIKAAHHRIFSGAEYTPIP